MITKKHTNIFFKDFLLIHLMKFKKKQYKLINNARDKTILFYYLYEDFNLV